MTSCQSRCWSVRAAAVNPGQHYLRKEILLWKHQPSPLAASSTNTPRAPRGRWGGCGSRVGARRTGVHGTVATVWVWKGEAVHMKRRAQRETWLIITVLWSITNCARGSDCISVVICSCKAYKLFHCLVLPARITSSDEHNSVASTNWQTKPVVKKLTKLKWWIQGVYYVIMIFHVPLP